MEVSLYSAAAAMNATEQWQDVLAQNLATAPMVGGRKHSVTFSAVEAGVTGTSLGNGGTDYVMPLATDTVSFQQGKLERSNSNTDFALEGPGFFTVQMPTGQLAYTRNGEFTFNAKGQMVTKTGNLVLSTSGPITKDPVNPSPITISPTGEVSQGIDAKGKLALADFSNPQLLTMGGDGNFYANSTALSPKAITDTNVRQNFVEEANTTPTLEMSGLITAMRMFETNQKVMQLQNDRMTKAIADLGAPPNA